MAVKFLTKEWADAITEALNSSDEFRAVAASKDVRLQQVVTGGPLGDVKYYFSLDGGAAQIALGELADSDATVTQTYATAAAISRGDVGATQAFMQGKLKITGNMIKLMQLQDVLGAMPKAVESIRVEY